MKFFSNFFGILASWSATAVLAAGIGGLIALVYSFFSSANIISSGLLHPRYRLALSIGSSPRIALFVRKWLA